MSRDGHHAKRARASDAWQAALGKIDGADDADDNCDDDNVEPPPGAAVGSDTDAPGEDEGYLSEFRGEENIADHSAENEDTDDGDVDRLIDILAFLDAADGRKTGEERVVVREAAPADAGPTWQPKHQVTPSSCSDSPSSSSSSSNTSSQSEGVQAVAVPMPAASGSRSYSNGLEA